MITICTQFPNVLFVQRPNLKMIVIDILFRLIHCQLLFQASCCSKLLLFQAFYSILHLQSSERVGQVNVIVKHYKELDKSLEPYHKGLATESLNFVQYLFLFNIAIIRNDTLCAISPWPWIDLGTRTIFCHWDRKTNPDSILTALRPWRRNTCSRVENAK